MASEDLMPENATNPVGGTDYRTVPVEPTEEMIAAGERAAWDDDNSMPAIRAMTKAWSAMLAAAPALSASPAPAGDLDGVASEQTLHYLRTIYRRLQVIEEALPDELGLSLGGVALADERDWLDCHIDYLERTARAVIAAMQPGVK